MSQNRTDVIDNNVLITGDLTFGSGSSVTLPNSAVTNAMIVSSAGISASKQEGQVRKTISQSGAIAAATQVIHHCRGTVTNVKFWAGSIAAATAANACTVDLKKNGTTMLSAVITLDSSNTAYVGEAATVSVSTASAGDTLTVVITNTATWNGTGLFCELLADETYAST